MGLDTHGMLRRNNLLTAEQFNQLSGWISDISEKVASMLEGAE